MHSDSQPHAERESAAADTAHLLATYGLAALADDDRETLLAAGHIGRVITAHRTRWQVVTAAGEHACSLAGHFHVGAAIDRPVVGDWVALRTGDGPGAIITTVAPRRSLLRRVAAGGHEGDQPIAANIDTVFVVGGSDGDHNHRRLRRYLALVRGGGADPVVLLNKVDLVDDPATAVAELAGIDPLVPVHAISAQDDNGLDVLAPYLQSGHTLALLGSSGVGKSTIVNGLLGVARQATGAVRTDDSQGRHTTTHRELIPHSSGAVIMDTPGMRELALSAEASDLDAGFADLASLTAQCRFRDCSHGAEPGCAVQAAIDRGELPADRLADFQKLEREAMIDSERKHERNARMKRFGRVVKDAKQRKGRW